MSIIEVNGHTYDHTSLRLGLLQNTLVKDLVKSITYDHGFTVGDSYGTSPVPIPPGMGKYKASGSLEVYLEAWQNLLASDALPDGYLAAPSFPITLSYKARGGPLHQIEMRECRILKEKGGSSADGQGALTISLELYVRYIVVNGKTPFSQQID